MNNSAFRELMREEVKNAFPDDFDSAVWKKMSGRLFYAHVDYEQQDSFKRLRRQLDGALKKSIGHWGTVSCILLFLLTVYEPIISNIGSAGLSGGRDRIYPYRY